MINQTISGILKDEPLMKNFFTGLGYYAFIALIIKLVLGSIENGNYLGISLGLIMSLLLITFVAFFNAIHVIRPIVKIIWSDFEIPGIDNDVKKTSLKEMLFRNDILIFIIFSTVSLLAGLQFIQLLLETKS